MNATRDAPGTDATRDETQSEPIRPSVVYPLADFMQRVGIGEKKLRDYIRRGLIVRGEGKTRFVRGADWDAFVKEKLPVIESVA